MFYGLKGTRLNIAIAVIAGIDFALFGYDQGVMGGLLTLDSFLKLFPEINTSSPPAGWSSSRASNTQGITVGGYTLGCFFGACATIFLGNVLGRKRTIFTGTSIMVVGAILQCTSFSIGQLIPARLITGFGNGMNTSTVPTWQSETSKSHRRGQMVMIEGTLIVFGVMLSYWIDFGLSFANPSEVAWRFPIAFQVFLCLIILVFIPGLPESPRWLVLKGREDKALEVLCALSDLPPDDKAIQSEFQAVKDTVLEMSQGRFQDCFKQNRNRNFHRTVLGYVNQMFQQISGINIITYYIATIFEKDLGLTPFLSRLLAACNGTEYFLASFIAIPLIERTGRRKLMIGGAIGQTICMVVLAGTNAYPGYATGVVAVLMLFLFNTFFAIGWLGMTWLYPAEITPLSIRAPANAIATTANWIFNFLIVMITPPCFNNIGWRTYIIYAVLNGAVILPVSWIFFPETAYRSLEEMDEIFHKSTGWTNAVKVSLEMPHRFGKNGELLIPYEDTDLSAEIRRTSIASQGGGKGGAAIGQFENEKGV